MIHELEVSEVVNIDFVLQDNDDTAQLSACRELGARTAPISPQLDGFDFRPEGQLANATILVIVPNHHLTTR